MFVCGSKSSPDRRGEVADGRRCGRLWIYSGKMGVDDLMTSWGESGSLPEMVV